MGIKTCEDIIKEGVRLAGVTYKASDTKQLVWLKDWLRSVGLGWPWEQVSTWEVATLPAGSCNLIFGVGHTYGAGLYLHRVTFPFKILLGENILPLKIYQQQFNSMILSDADVPIGTPDKAGYKIDFVHSGVALIQFNRRAKQDCRIQIPFQYDPAVDYEIDDVPWYPNDNTMIQAIAFKQSEDSNGKTSETTMGFMETVAAMLKDDKLKFGVLENFVTQVNRTPRMT